MKRLAKLGLTLIAGIFLLVSGGAEAQVIHGLPFWAQPYPAYYAPRMGGGRPIGHVAYRHPLRHNGYRSRIVLHARD